MSINKLKKLVDKWMKEKGFDIQCEACSHDIRVKPNDEIVECSHCDSSFSVDPLILKEIKKLM